MDTSRDGIENGQPCLVHCSNGIVDRQARIPLQVVGLAFREPRVQFVLFPDNLRLQSIDVGGDLRLSCIPVLGDAVVDGLDLLAHNLGCHCGIGAGLLPARHDLVVRFLLCRSRGIFGLLGVDRQVGKLFGELFSRG